MRVHLREAFNRSFDRWIRPEAHVLRRPTSTFKVCGYTGLVLAILLAMALVIRQGLSPWVMAGLVAAAMATFLALAMATKIVTGEEQLIYYHHEIAVVVVSAALLALAGRPVLPYLDAVLLGIGTFLACGRVGCLMVGCCHGRPHRWGVVYRDEHVKAGFTPYFAGVRLFPIQAVESAWVLVTVVVGTGMVLNGQPPGTAMAWYVIVYDVGRFCFEFARGDPARRYFLGFSEGQWTSLLLMCVVVALEQTGTLVFHSWHAVATAGLALAMLAVALGRRSTKPSRYQVLHPHHVRELAEALAVAVRPRPGEGSPPPAGDRTARTVYVADTSLGIRISGGTIDSGGTGPVRHYTLSCRHGLMSEEIAEAVANLVVKLTGTAGRSELLSSGRGIFHLVIRPV